MHGGLPSHIVANGNSECIFRLYVFVNKLKCPIRVIVLLEWLVAVCRLGVS